MMDSIISRRKDISSYGAFNFKVKFENDIQ